ncbi:MAG TPA: type II toxin-antitoxin system HicA family toxin [Candidatus Binatia bacterium]|nr:type II toxin-antitoxin system HicA family toxin [Candidatus Binatia bacterium]
MAALVSCSRREFIRKLRALGYDGPYAGGDHAYMTKKGGPTVKVPNPHGSNISVDLLSRILRSANINRDDWINA